jgi:photosystem II protein
MNAKIQFIKVLMKNLPDIRLTRSRDGSTGTATFRFTNPNILDKNTAKEGEITGMYLVDEEEH